MIQSTRAIRSCVMVLLLALGGLSVSCDFSAPKVDEVALTKIEYYTADTQSVAMTLRDPFVAALGTANLTIDIALAGLDDDLVAQALIDAKARGVEVRVVTDSDSLQQSGFVKLAEAGVTIISGDGELQYLPEPNIGNVVGVCNNIPYVAGDPVHYYKQCTRGMDGDPRLLIRPNTFNQMSNNFAVIDELDVWSWSTPILQLNSYWLGWSARSQDLAIAFTREFQQMAGGVFSTTLDSFNGPVKSTVHGVVYDSRIPSDRPGRKLDLQPGYLTNQGILRIEFNPQQRLTKEVIDEIYAARGSVYLMTDTLYHDFVISALNYKKKAGFNVRVVVRQETAQMRSLIEGTSVVRRAPDGTSYLPTVLIIDQEDDRDGNTWARTGMVLSHALFHQFPFEIITPTQAGDPAARSNFVRVYPSDIFVDGTLWTMREFLGAKRTLSPIENLNAFWQSVWNQSAEVRL